MIFVQIMHDSTRPYRGRFAPSPTGPLHFGSLVAAVGSYLEARWNRGRWLVRMEDLDRPREARGASNAILRMLEAYGFEWDGTVVFQSRRDAAYGAALKRLEHEYAVFPCACTRREISDSTVSAASESIYPGTCRKGLSPGRPARAMRVLRRADGLFAYQLAVVVDDFEQSITDVVRGADLLASTARQILLQRLLGLPTPRYMHLPVAMNQTGEKLSKQTRAAPLTVSEAPGRLWQALRFLGQVPPAGLAAGSIPEIWNWALANWRTERIPTRRSIREGDAG